MVDQISNILLATLVGLFLWLLSIIIESNFLITFLDQNLIMLIIGLLAVNGASYSILMTKLREIKDKEPGADFSRTINELDLSSREQVFLIYFVVMLQIFKNSHALFLRDEYVIMVLNVLLSSSFVYGIILLADTSKAAFILMKYDNTKQ